MSHVTAFGKRRVYLVNHDPVAPGKLDEIGWALSKFIALQTINEFRDGIYNDSIAGELYVDEELAILHMNRDEYYLELLVSSEAISHSIKNGQVFIHKGYAPKIIALKTVDRKIYEYDEERGFIKRNKGKISARDRAVYNQNPDRWPIFAAVRHHLPVSKVLSIIQSSRN
jgi:hypothetical protein